MLKGVLSSIVGGGASIVEREKGVAFLEAARPIYNLTEISYFCVNIPRRSNRSYVHCAFSSGFASEAITGQPIPEARFCALDIVRLCTQSETGATVMPTAGPKAAGYIENHQNVKFALRLTARDAEVAILGFMCEQVYEDPHFAASHLLAELKTLGNYFHNHILRRNGFDTSDALVVSAREIDCLKWMAAGKSAWEASVILGISERTVRFHLNSAREKLNCATTTQAVAIAVAQQLIRL